MPNEITLTIDGVTVTAKPGQTVIQAAMDAGIYVPYLCYWPGMKPYGACRMCVVEVEGQRGTPASCTLPAAQGMVVKSATPQVKDLRQGILELLLSEHPHGCLTCHRIELCGPQDICLRHVRVTDRCVVCPKNERCELKDTVRYVNMNLETPLAYNYRNLPVETRDPFYDRDYNLCIVCARCIRVCEEVRADDAIGMVDRSGTALVGTSRGTSLLESGCEFCGACVDVCPVGALVERRYKWEKAVKTVTSTCTHCPVGCQVKLEVDARGRVIRSVGDWSAAANQGQLCFKGKFGMDFVNHRARLKTPLVRRHGVLEEATWEEALDLLAARLPDYRGDAYAMLVSPRTTNEDAYLAQRFARTVMDSNNVDVASNARPEMLLSLRDTLGTMAATGTVQDLEQARSVLVVNSNTTEDHNVAAVPIKKAAKAGTLKLVVVDAREVELTRYADVWLRPYPGSEATLVAGLLRVIADEALQDADFIAAQTEGWDDLVRSLQAFPLSAVEEATGVPADQVQQAARLLASNRPGGIMYALDNVPADQRTGLLQGLIDLALATGNLGVPSAGLLPLLAGTNEQGAWDVGCVPGFLPGHVAVGDAEGRGLFERSWTSDVPQTPGVGVNDLFHAVLDGRVKAVQVVGDSPALDEAALHALSQTELLVVHDLFLSDLAQHADIVLPLVAFAEQEGTYTSLDRRVQLLRQAVLPKGESQPLMWVLREVTERMGAWGFSFEHASEVFDQVAATVPFYGGISHQRLDGLSGGLQWPCPTADHPGAPHLHAAGDEYVGTARFSPLRAQARPTPPREFPLLYTPGRVLAQPDEDVAVVQVNGHNEINREEVVEINAADAQTFGVADGDLLDVVTPLSRVRGRARVNGILPGVVAVTTLFGELATDLQTSEAPDPALRVPGLDVVPARLEKASG